jgi:hypothetical protein
MKSDLVSTQLCSLLISNEINIFKDLITKESYLGLFFYLDFL